MTRTPRSLALLAAGVAAVTVAGPALAADVTSSTPVQVLLSGDMPSRSFAVEKVGGGTLSTIDLGKGGGQPFQTSVTDEDLTGSYGGFDVEAEMTDFYLKKDDGSYDFTTVIPSSQASLEFPATPLTYSNVAFSVIPKVQLSSTVDCASSQEVRDALGIVVDPLLGLLGTLTALTGVQDSVCDALDATTGNTLVNGVETTVNSTLSSLADLPVKLTTAVGGSSAPFTNASYAPGSIAESLAEGKPAATKVPIMGGATDPSADLLALIQTQVLDPIKTLPVVSSTGAGAMTSLDRALSGLRSSSNATLKTLGDAVAGLSSATNQIALINELTGTVQAVTGADLSGIGGRYVGLPTLKAAPASVPTAGQYGGTLTVTFIQH